MASACVTLSPRISFSNDFPSDSGSEPTPTPDPNPKPSSDIIDFEFHHLNADPHLTTAPADELFSDGKLVPLHLTPLKPAADPEPITLKPEPEHEPETLIGSKANPDSFAVSPKAPTCTFRWRELLRLKRQQQQALKSDPDPKSPNPYPNPNRSLKQILLNRTSKPEALPLLKDTDPESQPDPLSTSSRLSLSEDLPRISTDSENKLNQDPILLNRNPTRARRSVGRRAAAAARGASVDSPRMNASGKVVFVGLGRSASSPSTCGARGKSYGSYRGMERSYSAGVRVAPVLNVGVCKLRGKSGFGLGQLFSGSGSGPKSKN